MTKVALHGPLVEKGNRLPFRFYHFPNILRCKRKSREISSFKEEPGKNNSRLQTFSDLKETKENIFIIVTTFTFSSY